MKRAYRLLALASAGLLLGAAGLPSAELPPAECPDCTLAARQIAAEIRTNPDKWLVSRETWFMARFHNHDLCIWTGVGAESIAIATHTNAEGNCDRSSLIDLSAADRNLIWGAYVAWRTRYDARQNDVLNRPDWIDQAPK